MSDKAPLKAVPSVTERAEKGLVAIKTRMGTFVGKEVLDKDGNITGFDDVCEVLIYPTPQGIATVVLQLGEMIDFPEDVVMIGLTPKSILLQKYKEEMTGIQTANSQIVRP